MAQTPSSSRATGSTRRSRARRGDTRLRCATTRRCLPGTWGSVSSACSSRVPSSSGFEIVDDGAEEAFTVYDHPKVLVFRKSPDYSQSAGGDGAGGGLARGIAAGAAASEFRSVSSRHAGRSSTSGRDCPTRAPSAEPTSLGSVLRWLGTLELLSLASFALVFRAFVAARDHGYTLARLAAWLGPGSVVWWMSSVGLASNSVVTARVVGAAIVLAGTSVAWRARSEWLQVWRGHWRRLAVVEGGVPGRLRPVPCHAGSQPGDLLGREAHGLRLAERVSSCGHHAAS